MNIRLEYTGQLQSLLGRATDTILLPAEATIATLLEHLATQGSDPFRTHLRSHSGHWQPSLLVAVNGVAHSARLAETVTLNDGDVVTLLPPIGGG